MAIYPKPNPAPQRRLTAEEAVNIEAWTEHAAEALQSLSLSSPQVLRGTSASLAIPLDGTAITQVPKNEEGTGANSPAAPSPMASRPSPGYRRREPIRRDSQKRRDALLKGKEGSRRRHRWENGML